jgi:hypothetical protein
MVKNAYPELPELPYQRTSVEMPAVIEFLKSLCIDVEVKRAAYIFFRMESANGRSGVNNNYAGVQADGARWPEEYDDLIIGTSVKQENRQAHGGGKVRRFVVFNTWKDSILFTVRNVERRGMYIGGHTSHVSKMEVDSLAKLVMAYKREWVTGQSNYVPSASEMTPFFSMYKQAEKIFTK